MSEAFALEAQDVCKRFDGAKNHALADISLAVKSGEFYSFLGPSGCGKTTMLRIFAGFESASSGNVLIAGRLMNGVPPNKRPVNMVFQSYALFPHLSVLENVAFGLRARGGLNAAEILARSKESLATVRLGSFGDRLPAQLSGGQQQRVALARALVMRPVVLLLDEPLSALDVQIREEMQEELSRLQRELNITFVMVTHDQSEALALSSSVAVFNHGKIEQIGNPLEIYSTPQTAFVARFIGRSNVMGGKVLSLANDEVGQSIVVELDAVEGLSPAGAVRCRLGEGATVPPVGAAVELCIKPEAVLPVVAGAILQKKEGVTAGDADGSTNVLSCRLESSSYQGSLADLRLNVGGMIVRATVAAENLPLISAASELKIYLPPGDLRLLRDGSASQETSAGEALHAVTR